MSGLSTYGMLPRGSTDNISVCKILCSPTHGVVMLTTVSDNYPGDSRSSVCSHLFLTQPSSFEAHLAELARPI